MRESHDTLQKQFQKLNTIIDEEEQAALTLLAVTVVVIGGVVAVLGLLIWIVFNLVNFARG